uniref:Uncharacterized protein LOC110222163 n=1 Tax=Phascolarctos cinereus TaxID=38626 RepID=A0A6P5LZD6_PHACI|nr:uncharacterized protein LOC110222163 [Phascolarctos cinereus]
MGRGGQRPGNRHGAEAGVGGPGRIPRDLQRLSLEGQQLLHGSQGPSTAAWGTSKAAGQHSLYAGPSILEVTGRNGPGTENGTFRRQWGMGEVGGGDPNSSSCPPPNLKPIQVQPLPSRKLGPGANPLGSLLPLLPLSPHSRERGGGLSQTWSLMWTSAGAGLFQDHYISSSHTHIDTLKPQPGESPKWTKWLISPGQNEPLQFNRGIWGDPTPDLRQGPGEERVKERPLVRTHPTSPI